jgi:NAD(P)-dependent dehydrogenase (short-subunit alcohol dehydrogenase family)
MTPEPVHHPSSLAGRSAVVTGASSGIGRAIAVALGHAGAEVCAVGRSPERLAETVAAAGALSRVKGFQLDLRDDASIQPLCEYLAGAFGRLDVLVHGAGVIQQELLAHASIDAFDDQFAVNLRAPYLLTQRLLPLLLAARGQIVFINSSAALSAARPEIGQYAATKHALKAVADSLRAEVNSHGIRVLSVFLGRTATPMQETLFKQEGRAYRGETLLQPGDVATMVLAALTLPATAEVTDMSIRPMIKS